MDGKYPVLSLASTSENRELTDSQYDRVCAEMEGRQPKVNMDETAKDFQATFPEAPERTIAGYRSLSDRMIKKRQDELKGITKEPAKRGKRAASQSKPATTAETQPAAAPGRPSSRTAATTTTSTRKSQTDRDTAKRDTDVASGTTGQKRKRATAPAEESTSRSTGEAPATPSKRRKRATAQAAETTSQAPKEAAGASGASGKKRKRSSPEPETTPLRRSPRHQRDSDSDPGSSSSSEPLIKEWRNKKGGK